MATEVAAAGARMPVSVLVVVALVMVCLSANGAAAQQARGVAATYHLYHPEKINWDLRVASVYCATWYADEPLAWRKRYGWTAFCGPAGTHGQPSCGRCLQVTNRATGARTVARVLDQCDNGGLDLDVAVFRRIDTNRGGVANGHLMVDYEFVGCKD